MNNLSLTETELQHLLKVYVSFVFIIAICLYFIFDFLGNETFTAVWR